MKVHAHNARLGNFFVVEKAGDRLNTVGGSEGYALYEDAEVQLRRHKTKHPDYPYLILQVVGEFRAAVQLTQVLPMEAD
jgi:uncharacterized membrane protein YsdA (DUF1294 family)